MKYVGKELELFENATNWKEYWGKLASKECKRSCSCVEIGSGIGANAPVLSKYFETYCGIEPDQDLVKIAKVKYPEFKYEVGTSANLSAPVEGCVMYIDVLEHIENDRNELVTISEKMSSGAYIFILVPAHMYLFSAFDQSVGHFRRYSKRSLTLIMPDSLEIMKIDYLDSFGFVVLIINKLLRKKSNPSKQQILIWDKLILISKFFDVLFRNKFGKSIYCVAQKN